jgi:hypothetical protein
MQTRIKLYATRGAMERGIRTMERQGWTVLNTQLVQGRYGCLKTGALGCLFFPLALLGRKRDTYQVTFQRS